MTNTPSPGKGEIQTHPVQTRKPDPLGSVLPQVVTLKAYEVYCHLYGSQPAMVTGNCRSGFGIGEIVALLYAHSFPKSEWDARTDEALRGMRL